MASRRGDCRRLTGRLLDSDANYARINAVQASRIELRCYSGFSTLSAAKMRKDLGRLLLGPITNPNFDATPRFHVTPLCAVRKPVSGEDELAAGHRQNGEPVQFRYGRQRPLGKLATNIPHQRADEVVRPLSGGKAASHRGGHSRRQESGRMAGAGDIPARNCLFTAAATPAAAITASTTAATAASAISVLSVSSRPPDRKQARNGDESRHSDNQHPRGRIPIETPSCPQNEEGIEGSGAELALRDIRQPRCLDDRVLLGVAVANLLARPDVGRRHGAEFFLIPFLRSPVAIVEFGVFSSTAFGRFVMDIPAQHATAEIVPVATGVHEVQVPGFIDFLRRGQHLVRDAHQVDEFFVFFDDTLRKLRRPAVLSGKPGREGQIDVGLIEIVAFNAMPEIEVAWSAHLPSHRRWNDKNYSTFCGMHRRGMCLRLSSCASL
jgi:hypothetical protein